MDILWSSRIVVTIVENLTSGRMSVAHHAGLSTQRGSSVRS